MKQVRAQITDSTYEKIRESGKSVYQFVQDAIADQINAIERKEEIELMQKSLNAQFQDFQKFIDKNMQRIEEQHTRNQFQINERINQAFNHLEGSNKEYNRILNILNQNIEEIRNQM